MGEGGKAEHADEDRRVVGGKEDELSSFAMGRSRSWARMLRRIYEADPLVCPCGGELEITGPGEAAGHEEQTDPE